LTPSWSGGVVVSGSHVEQCDNDFVDSGSFLLLAIFSALAGLAAAAIIRFRRSRATGEDLRRAAEDMAKWSKPPGASPQSPRFGRGRW
jgi:hypothetical protein